MRMLFKSTLHPPAVDRWSPCIQGRQFLVRLWLALAALNAVVPGTAWSQELTFLPGSSWGIALPPAFQLDPASKAAFVHPAGALVVVVTTMQKHDPSRFTPVGATAGSGLEEGKVVSMLEATVSGNKAYLMRIRLVRRNADSFVMAVQGETSGLITVMLPDSARSVLEEEEVLRILYSAVERPLTTTQRLEGLPFSIGELAGMRVSATISALGVILTNGPGDRTADTPEQSFVTFVAYTPDRAEDHILARDPDLFGQLLVQSFPGSTVTRSAMVQSSNGSIVELSFQSKTKDFERPGVAWAYMVGRTMMLMIVQLPVGHNGSDTAAYIAMRDSVTEN